MSIAFARVGGYAGHLTGRDVVRLQLLGRGVLGVGQDDRAEGLARGGEGGVVNAGDARAW